MPPTLVTPWYCVAQSGPTIDGRDIKPEWLTDMGETYDPAVYKAKLWVDHKRWYGAYGSVEALKAEKAGDVVKLFAKVSPTRSLIEMNKIWEEKLHSSIEVQEDFAKTGKFYLGGLGITDEPASLGTDEMRFSRASDRKFTTCYAGDVVPDFREMFNDDKQVEHFAKKFIKAIFRINKPEHEKEGEESMDKKQFEEFQSSLQATQAAMTGMADTVKEFIANQKPAGGDGDDPPPVVPGKDGGDDAGQFTALQTGLEDLGKRFDTLVGRLETAVPGTQFGDTPAPAGDQKELL